MVLRLNLEGKAEAVKFWTRHFDISPCGSGVGILMGYGARSVANESEVTEVTVCWSFLHGARFQSKNHTSATSLRSPFALVTL
jgi:hypothetical protein